MFDTREGKYYDDIASMRPGKVTRNGVMSMVNIDVRQSSTLSTRRFQRAAPERRRTERYAVFPKCGDRPGLHKHSAITADGYCMCPIAAATADFDGKYAMEDIYRNRSGNDGILQPGEDLESRRLPRQNVFSQIPMRVRRFPVLTAKQPNTAKNGFPTLRR